VRPATCGGSRALGVARGLRVAGLGFGRGRSRASGVAGQGFGHGRPRASSDIPQQHGLRRTW